jgi:hypothetical protein
MIDLGVPAHGLCYIKHVDTVETYANSPVIIPVQARDRVAKCQFEVVAVGPDEICEDPEECERPHLVHFESDLHSHRGGLAVGDWVLCRNRMWESTPDPAIFVVRQGDIIGRFVEAT